MKIFTVYFYNLRGRFLEKDIILSVKDLTKVYKMGDIEVHALRGVSFELKRGEIVVVLGASGSGKSTILNIIGGIDSATSGDVTYNDENITLKSENQLTKYRREAIGFIFQFYNLVPNLTAKENIMLASELSKNPLDVNKLIEQVDLNDKQKFVSKCSYEIKYVCKILVTLKLRRDKISYRKNAYGKSSYANVRTQNVRRQKFVIDKVRLKKVRKQKFVRKSSYGLKYV